MNQAMIDKLDWEKGKGLLPAIVQHADDSRVLMLGFMNRQALEQTISTRLVTFWSRTRERLWTKGESSGNRLDLVSLAPDCDGDTLLVAARPQGAVCHLGTATCFAEIVGSNMPFLIELDRLIGEREMQRPLDSYTAGLFEAGINRIAQKVGEEGVELALAAVTRDDEGVLDEAADLLYHVLVLLRARHLDLDALLAKLSSRHGA